MVFLNIAGKSIGSLIVLFFVTKLMGRKQVGQLNLFDYIIGITIGSVASAMILDKEIQFLEGSLAVLIYGLSAYLISLVTSKSIICRRLVTGSPEVIIENGKILYDSLKRSKIDVNDLLQEARNNGYFNISQVEYAIMEPNGRISFLLKSKYNTPTLQDLKIKADYQGLCSNLVIDGKIMYNNLKQIGKDEKWLMTRLARNGYEDIDNVLLVICDSKEKLTIFEKNTDLKKPEVLE